MPLPRPRSISLLLFPVLASTIWSGFFGCTGFAVFLTIWTTIDFLAVSRPDSTEKTSR